MNDRCTSTMRGYACARPEGHDGLHVGGDPMRNLEWSYDDGDFNGPTDTETIPPRIRLIVDPGETLERLRAEVATLRDTLTTILGPGEDPELPVAVIKRLRHSRRKVQRAARNALAEPAETRSRWWSRWGRDSNGKRYVVGFERACLECYRVAHAGECRP